MLAYRRIHNVLLYRFNLITLPLFPLKLLDQIHQQLHYYLMISFIDFYLLVEINFRQLVVQLSENDRDGLVDRVLLIVFVDLLEDVDQLDDLAELELEEWLLYKPQDEVNAGFKFIKVAGIAIDADATVFLFCFIKGGLRRISQQSKVQDNV